MVMDKALKTSASNEWWTPAHILEAVYKILGTVDLDPCSPTHEGPVKADKYYTKADNGLKQ
jgi:hypothetical protein